MQKVPDAAPDAAEAADHRPPSKSQRKRDSHALQRLGERLIALSDEQLRALPLPEPLPEPLLDAIALARRVTAREGRRRQLQFIGKLMRRLDPEPLQHALDLLTDGSRAATALLHGAELWRDRLLTDPNAYAQWLARHPQTPTARLEPLLAAARTEAAAGQHGRHYRDLFRLLRDTLGAAAIEPRADHHD